MTIFSTILFHSKRCVSSAIPSLIPPSKAAPSQAATRRWSPLFAMALALPLAGWLQPAKAATIFSYISSPYSTVGGGESAVVGPADGFEITPYNYDNKTIFFAINDFQTNPNPWQSRWWYLNLTAPTDAQLTVGVYSNAARFPDEGSSGGLDFYGNGRGNNSLTGSFTIWEFSHAEDGTLLSPGARGRFATTLMWRLSSRLSPTRHSRPRQARTIPSPPSILLWSWIHRPVWNHPWLTHHPSPSNFPLLRIHRWL
jgi:hypothetical protein